MRPKILYGTGGATVAIGIVLHFVQFSKLLVLFIALGYSLALVAATVVFTAKEEKNLNDV